MRSLCAANDDLLRYRKCEALPDGYQAGPSSFKALVQLIQKVCPDTARSTPLGPTAASYRGVLLALTFSSISRYNLSVSAVDLVGTFVLSERERETG